MPRRFREHDLERWPHPSFNQVATVRRRICLADDDVRLDLWLAVFDADVADQRQHLDLLVDADMAILLARPVEVCDDHARESADCGELSRLQLPLGGEGNERGHRFVVATQYQCKRPQSFVFMQERRSHCRPPMAWQTSSAK